MPTLETRRLGRTEIRAKALGLGCAWFGSSKSSDRDAMEGVRRAIELGINFVDTAPNYGESERRVGLALANGYRQRVYLETKVGTHPERQGDYSAEAMRWSVNNSLKVLKTDTLDSVLLHDPQDIEKPLAPGCAVDELLKMKEEGIVRHIGIGARSQESHRRAIESGRIEIVLTYKDYTLLSQTVAGTTLPLAKQHDVGIILASVLDMGQLAGPEPDRKNAPKAHAMWEWCQKRGISIRHLAMQFCLAAPIDGILLFGPANRKEVEEGYEAATAPVPPEVWRDFKAEFGVGP
jgi:aryl-alcohol dehydrogenase-like predicted oxidoreductase